MLSSVKHDRQQVTQLYATKTVMSLLSNPNKVKGLSSIILLVPWLISPFFYNYSTIGYRIYVETCIVLSVVVLKPMNYIYFFFAFKISNYVSWCCTLGVPVNEFGSLLMWTHVQGYPTFLLNLRSIFWLLWPRNKYMGGQMDKNTPTKNLKLVKNIHNV